MFLLHTSIIKINEAVFQACRRMHILRSFNLGMRRLRDIQFHIGVRPLLIFDSKPLRLSV